jgi:prepilin-type N-terminal cleavage/methylation domain-containing protein
MKSQFKHPGVMMIKPLIARRRRPAGFTLIELMITVAIVAILATIAYPNYRNYVLRGQIVNATNGLSALQANMERYYQDNRRYDNVGGFVSPCNATPSTLLVGPFQLSCSAMGAAPAQTYTLQAVGSGTTNGFTYTVDQTNAKATVISGVSGSWNTPVSGTTCWVIKEGPTC